MVGFFQILRLWALVSLPLGILVGQMLKANRRASAVPLHPRGEPKAVKAMPRS